jgi:tetratricopeptide (TPR) repeat protein
VQTGWKRAIAALAIVAAIGWAETRLPAASASGESADLVPDPGPLEVAALGFEAVLADYYWLRAVQVVGSKTSPVGQSELIGRLIDVVTTLDPWVLHPYRFAAVWMTDDESAVRKANLLLQRGIAHHPQDWLNRFHLGFNHFFYLGENVEAAAALEPAVSLPGAPRYLGRLVARLRSDAGGGELDAAAAFLNELLRQNPDPYVKAEYEKALDEIEVERRARVLDAAREEFKRRHHGRDIRRVEDLVQVAPPVLRVLPPEPNGWEWNLDPKSGQIVSAWVGHRYSVRIDETNQKMLQRFHARSKKTGEGS